MSMPRKVYKPTPAQAAAAKAQADAQAAIDAANKNRVDAIMAMPIGVAQFQALDALMVERYGDANLWTPYHF